MCYAYKPVRLPSGRLTKMFDKEVRRLLRDGIIKETSDGFYYPKATVEVMTAGGEVKPMRWDLIPSGFLRQYGFTLPEVIRKKNSRAKNPDTGRNWGFDTYNSRIETVSSLWSFKDAWKTGKRGLVPVEAWRERPNMDGAPNEFTGREYEVSLDSPHFLAALFDTWKSKDGETLDSCTIITGPSDEIPALQGIYHERTPIVLDDQTAEAWIDPTTTPEMAMAMLKGAPVPELKITEITKPKKQANE